MFRAVRADALKATRGSSMALEGKANRVRAGRVRLIRVASAMKKSLKAWASTVATGVFGFLVLYGFQSWYFPSSAASIFLGIPIACLGIVISFWAMRSLPIQYEKAKIRKPFFFAAMLVFIPIILWVALGIGIPSLVLKVLGPDENITTTVISNTKGRNTAGERLVSLSTALF